MFEERLKNSPAANFTLYPLFRLGVCFAVGIWAGNFFAAEWQFYLIICLISAVLAAVFLRKSFALIFLSIAFVAVGGLYFSASNRPLAANRLKKLYEEGQI